MKYLTNSKNVCQHFISKVFFQLSTIESFHEFYSELIHKQLDLMGLTYCEILNEINLSQVNLKSNSQPNTLPRHNVQWFDQKVLGTFAFCPQKSFYIQNKFIIVTKHYSKVFLWLQEKSLLGEGALVFNPAPGLFFTSVDMIRWATSCDIVMSQDKHFS